MKKIKVGIAGLGFIGPAHIEALSRIPGIEVVAVSKVCIEVEDHAFEDSEEDVKSAVLTSRNYLKQFLA